MTKETKTWLLRAERSLRAGKRRKDVLFLVSNSLLAAHLRPIHALLRRDPRLRLWFCDSHNGSHPLRRPAHLRAVPRRRLIPYAVARQIAWDAILYAMHDRFFRPCGAKIYIGHGLQAGKTMPDGEAYDFCSWGRRADGSLVYDKVFRSSAHIRSLVLKSYPDLADRIRVVGSLIADDLLARQPLSPFGGDGGSSARPTVMIVSSWGPHSLIERHGRELIAQLPALSRRYNVIVSIHPHNFDPRLRGPVDWPAELARVESPAIHVNRSPAGSLDLLKAADLLVTDFSSTGLYYAVLERPILFVDIESIAYSPMALIPELRAEVTVSETLEHLEADIGRAFGAFDPVRARRLSARLFDYRGQAAARHLAEIYDSLGLSPPVAS